MSKTKKRSELRDFQKDFRNVCRMLGNEKGGHTMFENRRGQMSVNVFMTYDELPEYILVMLDRQELIVTVYYYRAENDGITDIDLNKFVIINKFNHANLEGAELKYSKVNDVGVANSMIPERLKKI